MKTCARESCTRRPNSRFEYCSNLCRNISDELARVQRMCEYLGNTPESNRLWLSVVELNDAVNRVYAETRGLFEVSGLTPEEWRLVRSLPKE